MAVKKLAPGKWEASARDAAGKERTHIERTKELATKWERDFLTRRDQGEIVDPAARKITVRSFGDKWFAAQPYRDHSKAVVEGVLRNHVYPVFGDRRIMAVRPSEVKQWANGMDCAHNTRKGRYAVLQSIMLAAVADGIITRSPCQVKFATKAKDEAPLEHLSTDHIRLLEGAFDDRLSTGVTFGAGSGLRPMEWCGITVDRIDFLRGEVKVDRQLLGATPDGHPVFGPPKTPAGFRTVPLAQEVIDTLAAHIAFYGPGVDGLVFTSNRRLPVTPGVLYNAWDKARKKLGGAIPEWATPHDLRHYYASLLIAQGCNVKQVQRALGHEKATTTLDTYAHWWPDEDDDLRKAISNAWAPKVETTTLVPETTLA